MVKLIDTWFDRSRQGVAFLKPVRNSRKKNTDFRFGLVNTAFAQIFRQTVDELTGRLLSELVSTDQIDRVFQPLIAVLETGNPQQFEECYRYNNQDVWLHLNLSSIDGQVLAEIEDITPQKTADQQLQRRLAMESIVSTFSSRLLTLEDSELKACITDALAQIGAFTGADRAAIFSYSEDQQRGSCTHEWCAPGIRSSSYKFQNLPTTLFAWLNQQLGKQQVIQLNTESMPPEAAHEKSIFDSIAVRSLIVVPMIRDGDPQGFIGFYAIDRPKAWDEKDVYLLKTFSALIINAQYRQQQQAAIRRANQRLAGLRTIDQALLSPYSAGQSPLLTALQHINALVPCERLTIFRINEGSDQATAEYRLAEGVLEVNPNLTFSAHYLTDRLPLASQVLYIPDLKAHKLDFPSELNPFEQGFRSMIIIPLYRQHECMGAFTLLSTVPDFFTEEHRQIAQEVASQLAFVLNQQQQDQELKQQNEDLERRVEARTREIGQLSALHQAILEHAGQAILSTDIHGVIQTANPAAEKLIGYRTDELIGRIPGFYQGVADQPLPIITFQDPASGYRPSAVFDAALANQSYWHLECIIIGKDGQQVPILLVISSLKDFRGALIGYVGIVTDISALKAAEIQLRNLNQRFELATQAVGQGIWEDDLEQGKLIWDDRLWELHGIEPQGPDWSLREYINLVHPDDRASFLAGTHHVSPEDRLANVSRIIRPDGRLIYVEHQALVVRNPQGEPVRVIGVAWDVTERKQAEQALQQALQREQELNGLKSQFVSTASHEFRTPLTTIVTSVYLMKLYLDKPSEIARPHMDKHLNLIEQQVQNVNELLSDLLSIGALEAGKVSFHPHRVDVPTRCQQVIGSHFSHRPDGRKVQTSFEGQPYCAYLDEKLITQVLVNLLANAFKFAQEEPRLVIRFEPERLVMEIIDTGIGIPASDLPKLFEPFFRACNTTTIQGTGLGLVIARQYVELHGGALTVQSQEAKGSTFTIRLPRNQSD